MEAVEGLTIVLAVGVTRGWRSTLVGVAAAVVALAVIVVVVGPRLSSIPIDTLRLVVGALLLVFGLQWLRKAILRASGLKALHDEDYAFTIAFKGVFLEGLEVAFIVLTFGATQGNIPLAAVGAAAALVVVVLVGVAVRAPLARVPENALKFVVGILLASFGVFWSTEGAGVEWPGGDAALPVVVAAIAGYAVLAVVVLRRSATATFQEQSR